MHDLQPAPFPGYTVAEMHHWHVVSEHRNVEEGGPLSHYYYLHTAQFERQAVIHRDGPIAELPVALDAALGARPVDSRLGPLTLDAYVAHPESGVDGVIVLRGGTIVYETYPRMRLVDRHHFMSVSKPFASLLIAILAARGRIDVSQPVERYLPELTGSGWEGSPVQDILDMASGIDCREGEALASGDPSLPYNQYAACHGKFEPSTYQFVAQLKRSRPSGEAFEYTSADTFVLGWLAERITGLPYNELVSQEIWSKIGAEADAAVAISPAGAPVSCGGLSGRLRDLARFGLLFTPSRTTDDVVPPGYLDLVQRGGRPEVFRATRDSEYFRDTYRDDPPLTNSWQWDAVWPDGDFYKGGFHGQGLHVSPSRDLVIAFFGTPFEQGAPVNELRGMAREITAQSTTG
jgi:CubicO group peptidase (beta-lactamase class C family)